MTSDEKTNLAEGVRDLVGSMLQPEDVFDAEQLEEWALENGFVKESEVEKS